MEGHAARRGRSTACLPFFRLASDGSAKGGMLPESFSLFFKFDRLGHLATLEQKISEKHIVEKNML